MSRKFDRIPKSIKVIPGRIQKTDIKIPTYEYKVVAQPILKTAFTGHVTPLPTVLLFYLYLNELRVVGTIIQETLENGACLLTMKQFQIRLKMLKHTLADTLHHLRKLGIIYEERKGWKVKRAIDYSAVQHLNDILANEDRGIYTRLRRVCKLKNIKHINEHDLERSYDKYVLPVDHDIEEEEEYE